MAAFLVPDLRENAERCSCPGCPSKPDDDTLLYCGRGLSTLRVPSRGCICTDCPIYRAHDLTDGYFCMVEPERWEALRQKPVARSRGGAPPEGGPS